MHGSICVLVQKFVETNFGVGTWIEICEQAGFPELRFSPIQDYADDVVLQVVHATCEHLSITADAALLSVGQFAAPELIRLAKNMLHPEWRAFEVLNNLESLIHRTVRLGNPSAEPADIESHQISDSEMQVVYSSRRGLCALAHGILLGMGDLFSQNLEINEVYCSKRGDPFCTFSVVLREDASAESSSLGESPIRSLAPGTDSNVRLKQKLGVQLRKPMLESTDEHQATVLAGLNSGEGESGALRDEDLQHSLPSRVGRYRVLKLIGAGGMGIVFLGVDEDLQRKVAIKTLRYRKLGTPDLQMFISESRQLARVNHSQVVKIFDTGKIGNRPYFVMEWLEGSTLRERLDRNSRISFNIAARMFIDILDGLEAVHRAGIIHRDIKPGNIMISPGGTSCTLLDFGLAESFSGHRSRISGTLLYLAPERRQGFPGDYRSDYFSLAVLSLELFVGIPVDQLAELSLHSDGNLERLCIVHEWNVLNHDLKEMIKGILQVDPDQRLCDLALLRSIISRLSGET